MFESDDSKITQYFMFGFTWDTEQITISCRFFTTSYDFLLCSIHNYHCHQRCHFIMNMKMGRVELLDLPAVYLVRLPCQHAFVTMVTYLVKVSQVYDTGEKKLLNSLTLSYRNLKTVFRPPTHCHSIFFPAP